MPSNRIAESLAELEHRFDPLYDSTAAMEEFRRDKFAPPAEPMGVTRPPDPGHR